MNSINILGRAVKIKPVGRHELAEAADVEPDRDGSLEAYFDPFNNTIYIYKGLDAEGYKHTLLHEIVHAYFCLSGMTELLEEKQEEAICMLLENMLPLFQDKKFVEHLNG